MRHITRNLLQDMFTFPYTSRLQQRLVNKHRLSITRNTSLSLLHILQYRFHTSLLVNSTTRSKTLTLLTTAIRPVHGLNLRPTSHVKKRDLLIRVLHPMTQRTRTVLPWLTAPLRNLNVLIRNLLRHRRQASTLR